MLNQLNDIVHQLLAYDPKFPPSIITNRFVDGLKKEIRAVVTVHRPQDLDASLAILQEEADQDPLLKKSEPSTSGKRAPTEPTKPPYAAQHQTKPTEEKKVASPSDPKSGDDKLSALEIL